MNITVAVFMSWALAQAGGLIGQGGFLSWVAGLTFLGYAGLYLAHRMVGARPARSCEIATADVFCERYRRRRSIVYLRARVAFECKHEP